MEFADELKMAVAASQRKYAKGVRRRDAIVLTNDERELARADGLTDDEARAAKDAHLCRPELYPTFSSAVEWEKRAKEKRAVDAEKEAVHQAKLFDEKQCQSGERDADWIARRKAVDKREASRVRRKRWRGEQRYYAMFGAAKSQSYSGTNRNNRRQQKPPAYYKAKDEIDRMKADLLMLEFMAGQCTSLESKARELERLRSEEWATDIKGTLALHEHRCREIRERYGLPNDIEDFRNHPEVAQAYAVLATAKREHAERCDRWRMAKVSMNQVYTLWRNELAVVIREKHRL